MQINDQRRSQKSLCPRSNCFSAFAEGNGGYQQAARTLLKYREFASRNTKKKLEITFVDNLYTNALSSKSSAG